MCKLRADGASIPEDDLAELEEENTRLKAEFDKAKKVGVTRSQQLVNCPV